MWQEILEVLKEEEFISLQKLTNQFNITSSQLNEILLKLGNLGYQIEGNPYLGYRINKIPDRLFPWEIRYNLDTEIFGKKIYYFENVTSTQDIAFHLSCKDEGILIVAENQTKGRGRWGRGWLSFPYKGLYFSLIFKPQDSFKLSLLSLLLSVSVAEVIEEIFKIKIGIKWPNDLILENKKLAGILTEVCREKESVIVVGGIGVNVNNEKQELPPSGISLKEFFGGKINRLELLKEILRKIERNYVLFKEKKSYILEKWHRYNITLGKKVEVVLNNQKIEGIASALDEFGYLLVRKDNGEIERIANPQVFRQSL
ncbi:MAG: biotin--[acetyl-CoA-carboxylase] ligase [Candidatus Omnitrophica bacterium 4484_70.1]|nr:MAG: biotin--[acetyl-CoA-carboxylase] ligase [Candidatus Omnitrophica bacterium 4484_70.1]